MNKLICSIIIIFALISCAKENTLPVPPDQGGNIANAVSVNFFGFENEDGTKAEVNSELKFSWSTGDVIGVWPLTVDEQQVGSQLGFTLNEFTGSHATFKGSGWGLICDNEHKYASYFPYSSSCSKIDSVTVTYPTYADMFSEGQLTHVNKYLYMYAPAIAPENTSSANFNFYQLGTLAKFVITPNNVESKKFRKITISAENNVFYTSASYDLSKEGINGSTVKPDIKGTPTQSHIGANLYDLPASTSDPLTLYFTMCPAALKDVVLTVNLYDDLDSLYTGTYTCKKNQEVGMSYYYNVGVNRKDKVYPDPAEIEGVDLGIGLLFAPFNLGATSPEENGWLFAYGETVTKPEYTSSNYTRYIGGSDSLALTYKDIKYRYDKGWKTVKVLEDSLDAAVQMWGNGWFIPDYNWVNEWLQNHCDKEWVTCNGIGGFRFYNPQDHSKSIFIPCASKYFKSKLGDSLCGLYWTAYPKAFRSYGYLMCIQERITGNMGVNTAPHLGNYIRPVKIKPEN